MTVGDIHWVELPATNGHEQQGRRPAVILQDDQFGRVLPLVFVIPLTTSPHALRFAGTLRIQPTDENGLVRESIALVFQLRAVDRRRIREYIGRLRAHELDEVFQLLDRLTGRIR